MYVYSNDKTGISHGYADNTLIVLLRCKLIKKAFHVGMCSKDAKLVLSVLRDDKDKSLLRFVDIGPIYVSPDYEMGIDDSDKYFPHDFDQMDGEVKMWLAARNEEAADLAGESGTGEGEEDVSNEDNAVKEQQSK